MALSQACPMWSEPVTFGGGMTMQKDSLLVSMEGAKRFCAIHSSYHLLSMSAGV